jgi:hypothetical protein
MTSRAQDVLGEALALPLEERADVAAELLASLDDAAALKPNFGDGESSRSLSVRPPTARFQPRRLMIAPLAVGCKPLGRGLAHAHLLRAIRAKRLLREIPKPAQ